MTSKVTSILGDEIKVPEAGEPDEAIVRLLEEALERARNGEIQHAVCIFSDRDLKVTHFEKGENCDHTVLLGVLSILSHDITAYLRDAAFVLEHLDGPEPSA
ncbi:MAG: hypothetical protein OXF23_01155 [Candidatus Dadabacteria bacterium]|nr:hypothetical protein [Candidatus Dadabacteria bacterium]